MSWCALTAVGSGRGTPPALRESVSKSVVRAVIQMSGRLQRLSQGV